MDSELHELFLHELADIYDAEQQLTKALPRLADAAESEELRAAFESHLEETKTHAERLKEIAESLNAKLKRQSCKAMAGIIEEGSNVLKTFKNSGALDAALISAAQKAEHYEIAAYGCLCEWADAMGHHDELEILQSTLEEEKAADTKLTDIAKASANQRGQ